MTGVRALLARIAKAHGNYRHPFWLALQRAVGKRVLRVEDRATGLRFDCRRGADRMFGEVFHLRLYDVSAVPVRAGDLVVDIGANHGFASCYFAQRGAEVDAYEPSPTLLPWLRSNVRLNGLEARVLVHPVAVTGPGGERLLFETNAFGGGMNSLRRDYVESSGVPIERAVDVVSVPANSTVEIAAGRRVRLLKLDCEGSEGEILAALSPDSVGRIDSIALEYHPAIADASQVLEIVRSWGGFQMSKPSEAEFPNFMLHFVNDSALRTH